MPWAVIWAEHAGTINERWKEHETFLTRQEASERADFLEKRFIKIGAPAPVAIRLLDDSDEGE